MLLPALLGYGEAAVAYAGRGVASGPCRAPRRGRRLGWPAQTAPMAALFARRDGFPRDTGQDAEPHCVAHVGIYLVWGRRARYRLLGLTIMPLAAGLLLASWLASSRRVPRSSRLLDAVPCLPRRPRAGRLRGAHRGCRDVRPLPLREERRLKRRRTASVIGRMPSLVTLDMLAARTVLVALPARRRVKRARPAAGERRRLRRADGRPAADDRRLWAYLYPPGGGARAAEPPTSPWLALPSSPPSGLRCRSRTSHELTAPHRPPRTAGACRAARAGGAHRRRGRRALAPAQRRRR